MLAKPPMRSHRPEAKARRRRSTDHVATFVSHLPIIRDIFEARRRQVEAHACIFFLADEYHALDARAHFIVYADAYRARLHFIYTTRSAAALSSPAAADFPYTMPVRIFR